MNDKSNDNDLEEDDNDYDDIVKLSIIEKQNIAMLILYRSLYILKRKFEQHKDIIAVIYSQYQVNTINNTNTNTSSMQSQSSNISISVSSTALNEILVKLTSKCNINIIPYTHYMELLIPDYIIKSNKTKHQTLLSSLTTYVQCRINKYNTLYLKKKNLYSNDMNPQSYIATTKLINQYNKRGDLMPLTQDNILAQIPELLQSNTQLIADTITLAIADYIQSHKHIAVIDLNEEFKNEIDSLFDTEILNKLLYLVQHNPKEEKNDRIRDALNDEAKVKELINYYEKLLKDKALKAKTKAKKNNNNKEKGKKENTAFIEKTLSQLYSKQREIDTLILSINQQYEESIIKEFKTRAQSKAIEYKEDKPIEKNAETLNDSLVVKCPLPSINSNSCRSSSLIQKPSKLLKSSSTSLLLLKNKEDKATSCMKEIFNFYSKQHSFAGHYPTFDRLLNSQYQLHLSDYLKFCVDYKLNLYISKPKLIDSYQKESMSFNSRYLNQEQFINLLNNKLAKVLHEEMKAEMSEEINALELLRNGFEMNAKSNVNTNANDKVNKVKKTKSLPPIRRTKAVIPLFNNKYELEDQIKKLKERHARLIQDTPLDIKESMYHYLGIDNSDSYRKQMIGFSVDPSMKIMYKRQELIKRDISTERLYQSNNNINQSYINPNINNSHFTKLSHIRQISNKDCESRR